MRIALWLSVVFSLAGIAWYSFRSSDKISLPPEPHERPNDWFYRQRIFPYGEMNHRARVDALDQARAMRRSGKAGPDWQLVGPTNVVGRITGLAMGPEGRIVAGAASGGIWLSDDLGETWRVTDGDAGIVSIGDIDAVPSNRNIIYAGTGEPNGGGGSLTYGGMGVLKSTDGGLTWLPAGLGETRHIGRVAVHPTDPETVYVAAMGNLFSENPERGLYRSRDGGASWSKVLYVAPDTGAIDVVIDPNRPDTVYAATWQRIRYPDRRRYGGPLCHIHRSLDGGETWEILENGLPQENKGRIGLAISHSNPDRLYAMYSDEVGVFAGIYRSDDGGDSWVRTNDTGMEDSHRTYGWWFGRIGVHPQNPDMVFALGLQVHISPDGGDSWRLYEDIYTERYGDPPEGLFDVHVDQHDLVFHPENPDTIVLANDGGVYVSTDPEVEWVSKPGLAVGQFYTCEISEMVPERIYGGLQDNGTFFTSDTSVDNWENVLGGDGMIVLEHPQRPEIVYASYQYGTILGFQYGEFFDTNFYVLGDERANWTAPYLFDPNDPSIMYFGSYRLYKTETTLDQLTPISGDLTDGPGEGNIVFGTLTTLDIPKADSNVIYAGTDDGNVWVSTDGGVNFTNISEGLPKRWVTSVTARPDDAATAYVTLSGYRNDEYQPHVLVTRNMGADWTDISANLPEAPVNDLILADGIIFVASDTGVYASADDGGSWQSVGDGLPMVPVNDLDWHREENFLLAATYGRSMYKLDLDGVNLTSPRGTQLTHKRYLPEVRVDETGDTFIGVINPQNEAVTIELIAFDADGNELSRVQPEALATGGRFSGTAGTIFAGSPVADLAWVQLGASSPVEVFGELRTAEARSAYRAADSLEQTTWLPHVARDTVSFQTVFSSVNGLDRGLNHSINAGLDGAGYVLREHRTPLAKSTRDLRQVFGANLTDVTFAKLEGDASGAASMEYFVSLPDRNQMAALGLHGRSAQTLNFLHVATDTVSFWTGLVYLNVSPTPIVVTEQRFDADGNLLESIVDMPLEPGEKHISVFNETTTAGVSRVVVTGSGPLVGYELFGSNPESGNNLFAGLQASDSAGSELIYPHVTSGDGNWTGLVAVNLGAESSDLTFTAYDAAGNVLAEFTEPAVAPGARISRAVATLFPDQAAQIAWIRAQGAGDQWSGFQLWGRGGTYLSGLVAGIR
ncbi:MAG: hypothetical protein QNK37_03075 [Acidobacteriota bacterium]|nr:hypothetical protein [Acidobacteriota bacterium]